MITINWFEGSHYWEVLVNGKQVYTAQTLREAQMFVAELTARLEGIWKEEK